MSSWQGIGQERVTDLLRRAIERDRIPNAYLFSGPPGAPLLDAALALACGLNCERGRGVACGECDACSKILQGILFKAGDIVENGEKAEDEAK